MSTRKMGDQSTQVGVITDKLLDSAVKEQAPMVIKRFKNLTEADEESGAGVTDVHSLRLDFHSILCINNLLEFTALTKLQLDNNLIERIENLEGLVNLTWLGERRLPRPMLAPEPDRSRFATREFLYPPPLSRCSTQPRNPVCVKVGCRLPIQGTYGSGHRC